MADTVRVRVVGREHGEHKTGDEFEIRAEVAERHPNTLEVIEESDEEEESTTEESDASEEEDTDESGYSRDELEEMDYSELSELASESDDESIHGRSSSEDIIDTLAEE